MEGFIKKIKGIFPITTTKAVYMDGTSKTLQEAIDNGELGGSAEAGVNFVTDAYLYVNDLIFTPNSDLSVTIDQNKDLTLNRILCVCWSNGGMTNVSMESNTTGLSAPFTVPSQYALMWNSTDGFYLKEATYGVNCKYNEVLFAFNAHGRITGGVAQPIWERYYPHRGNYTFEQERYVNCETVARPSGASLHSMTAVGDKLFTLECYAEGDFGGEWNVYSLPDLTHEKEFSTHFVGTRSDGNPINLRLVTADYNNDKQTLIFGSSTADGSDSDNLQAYVFYDAATWPDKGETISFDNVPYTLLDFSSSGLFDGQVTAKVIWAELPDMIYLTTDNLRYCHKIMLGVGTTQLENGTYAYDASKRYNGTWKLVKTFFQPTAPKYGNKDIQYYDGALYYTIKYISGGIRLCKTTLRNDGTMVTEMANYDPLTATGAHEITGSPEGVVVYDGNVISAHADKPYFYKFKLF